MKTRIICVAGCARSGKTTVGDILAAELIRTGAEVYIIPIAKKIKNEVPCDLHENKEEWRRRLIAYGEYHRALHGDDFFVKETLRDIPEGDNIYVIIDDLRLMAERDILSTYNAYFIRMKIAPTIHIERFKSKAEHKIYQRVAKHDKTELELSLLPDSKFNKIINNSGNIEDLMVRVRKIVKDLTKQPD